MGTRLHAWAKETIDLGIKQPRSKKTIYAYVNDAIGFRMSTEVVLYYSDRFFGTADAISFRNGFLRIHDLKTGKTAVHMEQLEIYAALFCLEYRVKPGDIEIEQLHGETRACGITGAGDIDIIADVKSVSAGVTGAGSVTLKGKADVAKFGVSGAGDIEAEKMKVGDVEAGVSGSGDIYCHAIRRLAATSTSSGKVVYSGNPTEVAAGRNVKHSGVKK